MSQKIQKIWSNNWWTVTFWFITLLVICLVLFYFNFFHLTEGLLPHQSHADWFLVLVSIFAVIGAIWAVLARIDAEKAFTQSKETYDALSNSFKFLQVYDEDKLPYIYNFIGNENVTVTLFLNFPIVGLFENTDPKFVEKAKRIFATLITNLEKLTEKNEFPSKAKINIACYTKAYTLTFLTESKWENEKRRVEIFYQLIETLASKYNTEQFNRFYFDKDIGLRIALVNPNIKKDDGKALVWTVSDFTPDATTNFGAASFKTMDMHFIKALDKMFHNFKDKADTNESVQFTNIP